MRGWSSEKDFCMEDTDKKDKYKMDINYESAKITRCTGCGACRNICPSDAISLQPDVEGFYKPRIGASCVACNLCRKNCPVNIPRFVNDIEPECYAVMADDERRMRSSSGGMFEVLADYIFGKKGYVCGVVWKEDFSLVYHEIINNKKDLYKMQGSKYIQSDTRKVYTEVKALLEKGEWVLFIGCPCQIAGLYAVLMKDYDKLVTADLLCHGVPSVKVWQKYLREIHFDAAIESVSFRGKAESGWSGMNVDITFKNGKRHNAGYPADYYAKAFLRKVSRMEPCGSCSYSSLPRQGDISIGDYWGIDEYNPEFNDKKGTSVVLLNSAKSKRIFDEIKANLKLSQSTPIEAATKRNVINKSYQHDISRAQFFRQLEKKDFSHLVNWATTMQRFDVGIVGIPIHPNFGGALTYFALYHTLVELGYSVAMITPSKTSALGRVSKKEAYENIPYPTEVLKTGFADKSAMRGLSQLCDIFLVGSDQLFESNLCSKLDGLPLLDWVSDNRRKIAYAASFGHSIFRGDDIKRSTMAYYINKFDAFSTREQTGKKLLEKEFGIQSEWVLDPVFLCDKEKYVELSKVAEVRKKEPYIFAYILDPDDEKNEILLHVASKLGLEVDMYSEMYFTQKKQGSRFKFDLTIGKIEERLYSLVNSDFIVTDSFHGFCFAIIFEKPFITICNPRRGADRFISLIDKIGFGDRLVSSLGDITEDLLEAPNYVVEKVNLCKEKKRSLEWLREALSPKKNISKSYSTEDILTARIEELEKQLVKEKRDSKMKINSILAGFTLCNICDFEEYLKNLYYGIEKLIILISVKDTLGEKINKKIKERLETLGLKENILSKHWHSYAAIIDGGNVLQEVISDKTNEPVKLRENVGDVKIILVSKSYNIGNVSKNIVNDINYSVNKRGLNFTVLHKATMQVIDTVSFDTHVEGFKCSRD